MFILTSQQVNKMYLVLILARGAPRRGEEIVFRINVIKHKVNFVFYRSFGAICGKPRI